jgi:hypothetical protein
MRLNPRKNKGKVSWTVMATTFFPETQVPLFCFVFVRPSVHRYILQRMLTIGSPRLYFSSNNIRGLYTNIHRPALHWRFGVTKSCGLANVQLPTSWMFQNKTPQEERKLWQRVLETPHKCPLDRIALLPSTLQNSSTRDCSQARASFPCLQRPCLSTHHESHGPGRE